MEPTEARASTDARSSSASTRCSHRRARGRLVREGAQVAIVGAPNVGKSSLFNALLNTNRAIVTAMPGTTRDLLTERADIGGLSLALVDTAGVRETVDVVEQEGVARARGALRVADLVLVRARSLAAAVRRRPRRCSRQRATRRADRRVNKSILPRRGLAGDQLEL